MARYSGRYGSIGNVEQVQNWNLDITMTDDAQANSYTRGAKMRDESIMDWTGAFNFMGKNLPSNFFTADNFPLALYAGGATYGGNCVKFSGNAVWNSIALSGDVSSGGRVTNSVSFGGHGVLEMTSSATNTDTETPNVYMAHKIQIKLTSGGNTTVLDWKTFNFSVTSENQEYVGSDCLDDDTTGGRTPSNKVWKKRFPGLIDCTGTIEVAGDMPISTLGVVGKLEIIHKENAEDTGTTLLEMKHCRYMGTSGYTVDPSTGALVASTGSFSFMAHADDGVIGELKVLDSTIFAPSASGNQSENQPQ